MTKVTRRLRAQLSTMLTGRKTVVRLTSPTKAVITVGPTPLVVRPKLNEVFSVTRLSGAVRMLIPEIAPLRTPGTGRCSFD